MVDNEFNNYQRSYNNQEWNPAGSIARSNAHSRELGAILNTYLQVNPIEKLTLRTSSVPMHTIAVLIHSFRSSIWIRWRNKT